MHWRIKGAVQKMLGHVPFGDRLHYVLQRSAGGLTSFERECDVKVDDWQLMMGHLRTSKVSLEGATLLEMGTGWYPTFPLCLYLAGAERVHTFDLNPHLKRKMTLALAERLPRHVKTLAEASGRSESQISEKLSAVGRSLAKGASITEATNGAIIYSAPADASRTKLPDGSVNIVFSNSVLEHVPKNAIEDCFREAHRILEPNGIIFHSVNCGDHYAYVDRKINQLHYLRYSDAAWEKWNNAFLYQNRLRAEDFTKLARDAGFEIEIDTSRPHPTRLEQLAALDVDPTFSSRYSRDQLAITSIDFVGRKKALS